METYRGMDQATLDAAYDNSAAVAESARIIADWERRSAAVAASLPEHLDWRYGERERNRIDFFSAGPRGAPTLVFIHGGYWQMRAKEIFRFIAEGPLAHGINVALVAYTLAPDIPLSGIVAEVREGITWLHAKLADSDADRERLYVSGWSAGGHLTAMCLDLPGVRGGLAVSGIYDLEPIRLSYLNRKLALEESEVRTLSPIHDLPGASPPLAIAYGTNELPELQRQSREYAAAREAAGLPVRVAALEGHNHFTILEELASPDGALTALVVEALR